MVWLVGCGVSAEIELPFLQTPPLPTSIPVIPTTAPALKPVTPSYSPPTLPPVPVNNDFRHRQELMLDLINRDRTANGLLPVQWDETLTEAGRRHVADIVTHSYFSHWGRDGLGPEHRYTLAGGQHSAAENLHFFEYTYEGGRGAPIEDWDAVIRNAQTGLMNSPGHRDNILTAAHTHVGIGMAYNAITGRFALAQEFGNHYVALDHPLPTEMSLNGIVQIAGEIQGIGIDNILLNLAFEPFPQPLTLEELAQTNTYQTSAESIDTFRIDAPFSEQITLNYEERLGIYHIRVFIDINGDQALVLDHSIWVRQ